MAGRQLTAECPRRPGRRPFQDARQLGYEPGIAGNPTADADERVPLVFLPDIAGMASVLESYGTPTRLADERMGLWPMALQAAGPSVVESYGAPSRDRDERVDVRPKPDLEAGGDVLAMYGNPSPDPGERVDVLPQPDLEAGGDVLKSYGDPSADAAERVEVHPKPDLDAGGDVLKSYGDPSPDPGERVPLLPEPDLDGGGDVLKAYGDPSLDPGDRVSLLPEPDLDGGGDVLKSYGDASADSGERVDIHEKPDLEAGNVLESYGHPSRKWEERAPVLPSPNEAALSEGNVLEGYGQPTPDPSERVDVHEKPDLEAGNVLETYGNPSPAKSDRVDLDPEPDIDPGSSTLGGAAQLSRSRAERIDLDPEPDVDPESSTLGGVVQTSHDRTDRMGRHEPLDVPENEGSTLRLSTEREDRVGYIDPDQVFASSLGGMGSKAILEAGRMSLREDLEKAFTPSVPTGLEGLMPDPHARGSDRMRLAEDEFEIPPDLVGKIPVPPRVVEVVGTLPEAERMGGCGHERTPKREKVHRRMDFLYQRFEMLHVRRGVYTCRLCPDEPEHVSSEPAFVAGPTPLGNGLLAQIIAAVYDDHSTLFEQAGNLERLEFGVNEDRVATALDLATRSVKPVVEALRAEIEAAKGKPTVDKKGVDSSRPGRRRSVEGHLRFVSTPTARLLVHTDRGYDDPLVKSVPPSRRKGELIRDLFRERVGFNRSGVWAGVRRRFSNALVTSPQEAAYALFLIHAINSAASPTRGHHDELVRRSRALRAWLDDQRDQFDDPDTALQRSVVYALTSWDRMRLVDDTGDGKAIPEPEARRFPKTYTPMWDFGSEAEIDRATTWYSLVHTCRQLGVRPWEYFFALFSAMSRGPLAKPESWTPAAWASVAGL